MSATDILQENSMNTRNKHVCRMMGNKCVSPTCSNKKKQISAVKAVSFVFTCYKYALYTFSLSKRDLTFLLVCYEAHFIYFATGL